MVSTDALPGEHLRRSDMPGRCRGTAGPAVFAGLVARVLEGVPPTTQGTGTGWLESCSMTGGSSR